MNNTFSYSFGNSQNAIEFDLNVSNQKPTVQQSSMAQQEETKTVTKADEATPKKQEQTP